MKALWITGILAAVLAVPVFAQPVVSAKSGVIASGDGVVYVGDRRWEPGTAQFDPIHENTVVRTALGRVEVLLVPGSFLRLGENASFRLITDRLIDTRLEILSGSAVLEVDTVAKDLNITVLFHDATVTFQKAGIYRFDSESARIKVYKGSASVLAGTKDLDVNSGKMVRLEQTAAVEKFDTNDTDSLDNWSRRRGELVATSNISAARYAKESNWSGYANSWVYNPYFGVYTMLPMSGRYMSPYGYYFWSPEEVYMVYTAPQPTIFNNPMPSYQTMAPTSSGYSGALAASPSTVSSAPAASAGSSAASAAATSSVGHGSAPSGGGGHR